MPALLLYGFDDPESQLLLQGLSYEDASLDPVHIDSEDQDGSSDGRASEGGVALVWGLGKSPAHTALVSNRVAANGVPVVAVLDEPGSRGFDFHKGHLELCFNPHSVGEVLARIRVAQTRSDVKTTRVITHGNLAINTDSFAVTLGSKDIELTYKEYELLKLFASNPGRVFTREEILNRIWGDNYFGGTRTVDVHVRRLRSKLDDLSHTIIETMWRVGYRFRTPENQPVASSRIREPAKSEQ